MQRILGASVRGRDILAKIENDNFAAFPAADRVALSYAETLTEDVNGVSDGDFQKVRALYYDSQVAELTITVSLFNFFTRFTEALNLPVEP